MLGKAEQMFEEIRLELEVRVFKQEKCLCLKEFNLIVDNLFC